MATISSDKGLNLVKTNFVSSLLILATQSGTHVTLKSLEEAYERTNAILVPFRAHGFSSTEEMVRVGMHDALCLYRVGANVCVRTTQPANAASQSMMAKISNEVTKSRGRGRPSGGSSSSAYQSPGRPLSCPPSVRQRVANLAIEYAANNGGEACSLSHFGREYFQHYGLALRPEQLGHTSLLSLMRFLQSRGVVRLIDTPNGDAKVAPPQGCAYVVDQDIVDLCGLVAEWPGGGRVPLDQLADVFCRRFGSDAYRRMGFRSFDAMVQGEPRLRLVPRMGACPLVELTDRLRPQEQPQQQQQHHQQFLQPQQQNHQQLPHLPEQQQPQQHQHLLLPQQPQQHQNQLLPQQPQQHQNQLLPQQPPQHQNQLLPRQPQQHQNQLLTQQSQPHQQQNQGSHSPSPASQQKRGLDFGAVSNGAGGGGSGLRQSSLLSPPPTPPLTPPQAALKQFASLLPPPSSSVVDKPSLTTSQQASWSMTSRDGDCESSVGEGEVGFEDGVPVDCAPLGYQVQQLPIEEFADPLTGAVTVSVKATCPDDLVLTVHSPRLDEQRRRLHADMDACADWQPIGKRRGAATTLGLLCATSIGGRLARAQIVAYEGVQRAGRVRVKPLDDSAESVVVRLDQAYYLKRRFADACCQLIALAYLDCLCPVGGEWSEAAGDYFVHLLETGPEPKMVHIVRRLHDELPYGCSVMFIRPHIAAAMIEAKHAVEPEIFSDLGLPLDRC